MTLTESLALKKKKKSRGCRVAPTGDRVVSEDVTEGGRLTDRTDGVTKILQNSLTLRLDRFEVSLDGCTFFGSPFFFSFFCGDARPARFLSGIPVNADLLSQG